MAKNLAIIVGITDYRDVKMHLPACEKDVAVMQSLLQMGGRFDEVMAIPSNDAQSLKSNIASSIQRFQNDDIDHLLFYFTGHGEFIDDDFNYLLRDFDESRSAQTSLSNSELDGMLKSLSPAILIKVVDACYSGMPYIKDGSDFSDYITSSSRGLFPKYYFMFSSESDQKSYAEADGSDFTKAFAKSVVECPSNGVRYKDVIDFLSDSFSGRHRQKPYFVTQASFTESFGNYSPESKEKIAALITIMDTNQTPEETTLVPISEGGATSSDLSLVMMAQSAAKKYVSQEVARGLVTELKTLLDSSQTKSEIDDLYSLKREFFIDYSYSLPNKEDLGKWLSINKDGEYFASPTYRTESYEVDSGFGRMFALTGGESRKITKTRRVIDGIETDTGSMPFVACSLVLEPKYPNLLQYGGWFTYVISKTTIQVFFCFVEYREVSWGEFRNETITKWNREEFSLSKENSMNEIVNAFFSSLVDWASVRIKARLEIISAGPIATAKSLGDEGQ